MHGRKMLTPSLHTSGMRIGQSPLLRDASWPNSTSPGCVFTSGMLIGTKHDQTVTPIMTTNKNAIYYTLFRSEDQSVTPILTSNKNSLYFKQYTKSHEIRRNSEFMSAGTYLFFLLRHEISGAFLCAFFFRIQHSATEETKHAFPRKAHRVGRDHDSLR